MRTLPHDIVSLIHYVELNRAGWRDEFVERCALAVLYLNQGPAPMAKIKADISKKLGPVVRTRELGRVLKKLEDAGQIVRLHDGRYTLGLDTRRHLEERIDSFRECERIAREKFCKGIEAVFPGQDPSLIWQLFIDSFLVPLVDTEGARAYELLVGRSKIGIVSYMDSFLRTIPARCDREVMSAFLDHFLSSSEVEIVQFLLSYVDAYFLASVSGLPPKVMQRIAEMGKGAVEFIVFVDTNFVYSILGLHSNPSNEAAEDLMGLTQSILDDVHVRFMIRHSTLEETQQSIVYHRKRLEKITYPPNVAEAAAYTEISGVARTFFERVAASGRSISATDYLVPYESNLVRLLTDKGVTISAEGSSGAKYGQALDIIEDIERQEEYERDRYGPRAKTEHQITHDVVLWHFVQDQRVSALSAPIEAKYWIVTVDFRFLGFDKYKANSTGVLPVCMHPSQLIQVLRFFIPRSPQFEKTLLGVVRLPALFREFNPEAERISIRIASILARHEGIEDLDVDTLRRVQADEALRDCLASPIGEEEEIEAVQSALTKQIAWQETVIKEQVDQISALEVQVDEFDGEKEILRAQVERAQQEAQATRDQLADVVKQAAELVKIKDHLDDRARRYAKRVLSSFLGVWITTWIGLAILIWQLGWNVMEPWTFVLGFGYPIFSYLYFVVTQKELSPKAIYQQLVESRKKSSYQAYGLDLAMLERLDEQLTRLGGDIQ